MELFSEPHEIDALLERVIAALGSIQFDSFVVGFKREPGYTRDTHEAKFRRAKIALGLAIENRFTGTHVDFQHPDVRIDVDGRLNVTATSSPLFVAGRYRKLARNVSASRWIHHRCSGRGCESCGYAGTLCSPSIEELLSKPLLEQTRGKGILFHGLGREDTDARMLGIGRPFVVEVHRPERRFPRLTEVETCVNRMAAGNVEVLSMAPTTRRDMNEMKSTLTPKTYRAWIAFDGELPLDIAQRTRNLRGTAVAQMSPNRVKKRRGEHTHRTKHILESQWLGIVHSRGVWEVRVESGTYVKELVSGDRGRTEPSISSVLEVPCRCVALDVLDIEWQPPWESRERDPRHTEPLPDSSLSKSELTVGGE